MSDFDDFDFEAFDEDEDADDILDSFEDDEGDDDERPQLSDLEIDERLSAYQTKTKQNMRIVLKPKQFDKDQRLKALQWLGESGNIDAIPALLKVYKKDKTPGMKEAAAYALGQFKALDLEYDDLEVEQDAHDRVDNIILYGEFGEPAKAGKFIGIEIALAVLAIILFAVGFVLSQTVGAERAEARATDIAATLTAQPTPTPDTEDIVRSQLQAYYDDLVTDANFFQRQLAVATREESIDCDTNLENPSAYSLSELWANDSNFNTVTTQLNDLRAQMLDVRTAYAESCSTLQPIPRADALNYGGTILNVQQGLGTAREALNSAGIEVTEQVFMTPTPSPAEATDEPVATATVDTSDLTIPILELERIIAQMTDLQGATTRVIFNWQQVVDTEQLYLSGCNQPEPLIPNDYVLSEDFVGISANLSSAVTNVNTALQLTRTATSTFYAACDSGELPENTQALLDQANLADTAFASANNNLNALQNP